MEVEIVREGRTPIVVVRGEVDHSTAERLREALNEAGSCHNVILLDFADLRYIDSGGLSVLLRSMSRLRSTGWLGIIQASPNVMTLLSVVVAPGTSLRFFPSREEAVRAAGEPQSGQDSA